MAGGLHASCKVCSSLRSYLRSQSLNTLSPVCQDDYFRVGHMGVSVMEPQRGHVLTVRALPAVAA